MSDLKNVTYYSASAGTGKTYTLTEEMARMVKNGVTPGEIILTTYTKAAANEFKEKCREALYRNELPEGAAKLDMAKVGTVHSVAETFIKKYWYYLGISPSFGAIDENVQGELTDRELENLVSEEDSGFFFKFAEYFGILYFDGMHYKVNFGFWKDAAKKIAENVATYGIANLAESKAKSIERAKKVFRGDESSTLDVKKISEILDVVSAAIVGGSSRMNKADWIQKLNGVREACSKDLTPEGAKLVNTFIKSWAKNKTISKAIESTTLENCIPDIYATRQVQERVLACIEKVFDIAERWGAWYREYKDNNRIIDFGDMETMFLKLLKIDEVAADIRENYKVLLVDEFQDSSPIQIDIFNRLAKLVDECIWVGDYKQSIYGFRGTDLDLVQSAVKDVGEVKPLKICRRSSTRIVEVVNEVFGTAFEKLSGLNRESVLVDHWAEKQDKEGDGVYLCPVKGKKDEYYDNLANRIAREVRKDPKKASQIAVLCRKNHECSEIAAALSKKGVPVQGASAICDTHQCLLMASLLRLVVDAKDDLAKAEIAYLTASGYTTGKIIEEKVDSEAFLDEVPLLQKFMALRPCLVGQSVKSIVETLVVELNLVEATAFMEGDSSSIFCAIVDAAEQYESRCTVQMEGATVAGFVEELACDGSNKKASKGDPSGVVVMTYHKSKGLDWEKVFLCSLEQGLGEDENIIARDFLNVLVCKAPDFSIENMGSTTFVCYVPNVFNKAAPENVVATLANDPEYLECKKKKCEEDLRLLYVGMTRPKNQMHLVIKEAENPLEWFTSLGIGNIQDLTAPYNDESCETAPVDACIVKYDVAPRSDAYEPRDIQPSSTYGKCVGDVSIALDEASPSDFIPVAWGAFEADQMNEVGTCIHNIFAGLDSQADAEGYARNMIESQGMENRLPNAQANIVKSWGRLVKFLTEAYGEKVQVYHELPFSHLTAAGQIVAGSMDFVWRTSSGVVLVDFKNLHIGTYRNCLEPTAEHYLGKYKGQFDCYQAALEAHGEKILGRLIYQPITGRAVKIL